MSNSDSKQISPFKRSAWSNRFKVSKHKLIDKKLNKRLIKLLDTQYLKYGTVAKKFGQALKQKELAAYQSRLLNEYCSNPAEYLELDVDRLILSLELKDSDLERLLDDKFLTPYPKDTSRIISIKKAGVGHLNIGAYNKHKPRYKKGYQFTLYNDNRRMVHLAIADGVNSGKQSIQKRKVLRIDFVPQRFTDEEIEIVFGKLKYMLTTRRWQQLISNARVTRLDVGLNLPGIMSTFLYPTAPIEDNNKCLPLFPRKALAETTYIQHERNSNHFIMYEKLLKELNTENDKRFIVDAGERQDMLESLAITTRLERRFLLNKRAGDLPKVQLKNLAGSLDNRLFNLSFADPLEIHELSKKQQGKLLRNKIPDAVNSILDNDANALSVCSSWGQKEQKRLVQHYVDLLYGMESTKVDDIKAIANEYEKVKEHNVAKKIKKSEINSTPAVPHAVNHELEEIITTKRKRVLINAGAGSGKTTAMIKRVKHLLSTGVKASNIVFLSYNNDSVSDATRRLKSVNAGVKCQTFHSWALNIVKLSGNNTKVRTDISKCQTLLTEVVKVEVKNDKEVTYLMSILLDIRVNRMISMEEAYNRLCLEHEVGGKGKHPTKVVSSEQVINLFKRYKKRKKQCGVVDYNDMLEKAYRLLTDDRNGSLLLEASAANKHILLDEAQDSNKLQWKILKKLTKGGSSIFCVGDVAQSIYGFRGASPKMLDSFVKEFDSKPYFLTSHYRSTKEILALTNYVRRQVDYKLPDLATNNVQGKTPQYLEADGIDELAMTLAKLCLCLLKQGYKLNDVGILFRERIDKDKVSPSKVRFLKFESALFDELQRSDLNDDIRPADIQQCMFTMHGAKGMEWKVCIVVDPRFKQSYAETYDEHLTSVYVSLSRPQEQLFVVKTISGQNKFKDRPNSEHILDKIVEYTDSIEYLDINDM